MPVSANASPKKTYYGWYILAGCFFMMFLGLATRNSFGLFLKPMIADFNISRASLSLPFSLCLILYGASQPLGGLMMRRWDPKTVIIWGSALTTIAMLGIYYVDSLWGVYLFFGILLGVGGIGNSVTAFTPLVSNWFPDRRGLGMSIISAGSSMGQLILLPVFAYMIGFLDWRMTSFVIGVIFVFTLMPISIFLIKNAPTSSQLPATASRWSSHTMCTGCSAFPRCRSSSCSRAFSPAASP
ncbi:MAG: MFS transporter [Nitrospinae bacterium]|nr:MFS transporter [Nitrospinota bacterium]